MKVVMSKEGDLVVSPESSVENYALRKWVDEHEYGEGSASMIIEVWDERNPDHYLRAQEVKTI